MPTINGTSGDDTLNGTAGDDTINGLAGNDTLNGLDGNDTLDGGDGNDILDGGLGEDFLDGGEGDDTYVVMLASGPDTVSDSGTGGTDTLLSDANWGLPTGIENFTVVGVTPDVTAAFGNELDNVMTGNGVENQFGGGGGNDTLYGGGGNDRLDGEFDNDSVYGEAGDDLIFGSFGNDILDGGDGFDTLSFNQWGLAVNIDLSITGPQDTGALGIKTVTGFEKLEGSQDSDFLAGDDTANTIWGGTAGTDIVLGRGGDDTLSSSGGWIAGGDGNDTITVSADGVIEFRPGDDHDDVLNFQGGTDINIFGYTAVQSIEQVGQNVVLTLSATDSITFHDTVVEAVQNGLRFISETPDGTVTGSSQSDLLHGDDGNNSIYGAGGADQIFGLGGNDFLSGGAADDALVGGAGNDVLDGGDGQDTVYGGDGIDTVTYASATGGVNVSLAQAGPQETGGAGTDNLADFLENLEGSQFNDVLTGNELANVLSGGAGTDTLNGGDGNDSLDGGAGADVITGGLGNDHYYIDNAGDDIVEADGQGDDVAFVLGTYTLEQGLSIETLYALNQSSTEPLVLTGNEFGQSLYGNLGDNYLNGGQGADYLVGLAGNDNLLGGTGADHMAGGTGNDVYYVDEAGDLVTELADEGNDILVATASYALAAGVAIETMSAEQTNAPINLTGNELAQSLYGNSGNNILTGGGGADYMVGGAGNDKYYVDASDYIGESIGGGDDWIFVASSYTLREGNEIETLVAVNQDSLAQVDFAGNEFGQSLYGSAGVNNLNGGAGNDYLVGLGGNDFLIGGAGSDNLQGGTGNDLYYVDSGDQIFENAGEGDDLAVASQSFVLGAGQSVETLTAAEGSAAINLTGNDLAQSIYGNGGANILTTGGGADYLVGGAGSDTFVLTNAAGIATVADYAAGDIVDIGQYLSVTAGTNLVSGGYVKIVGTQLQVDANGGADSWVTIANVSGSGAVTIRYLSGGSATDLGIARSASAEAQSEAIVAKLALADDPIAHARVLDGWHAFAADSPLDDAFAPTATHLDLHAII